MQELENDILSLRKKLTQLKSKAKEPKIKERKLEVSKINGNLKPLPERSSFILSIESQEPIVYSMARK